MVYQIIPTCIIIRDLLRYVNHNLWQTHICLLQFSCNIYTVKTFIGPLELYHILVAIPYRLPHSYCMVLDFLRLTLPWTHPILHPIFYSFIGQNFRSNLLKNQRKSGTETANQSNHPWLQSRKAARLKSTSINLNIVSNLNIHANCDGNEEVSPKSDRRNNNKSLSLL